MDTHTNINCLNCLYALINFFTVSTLIRATSLVVNKSMSYY